MESRIDMAQWPRREVFAFNSRVSNPFYAVCFRLDVTRLYQYVKENGLSFYYSLTWLCTQAVNAVEAFHWVIRKGEVFRVEERVPSFTDVKKGGSVYHITTLPAGGDLPGFCARAREKSANQDCFLDESTQGDHLIYISCLPWMDLTALTNEREQVSPDSRDDSVPRIAWGKFVEKDGRKELGICLEVNHRLIDGVHLGMFARELESRIAGLP